MKKHKEDDLQIAAVTWFRLQYPDIVIFAIPNGGKRNAIEAAKMKRTGTLAGVADLFIMQSKYPPPWDMSTSAEAYHGLFIELKVGKNEMTESQKIFRLNAINAGYGHVVCRDIDSFMKTVNEYLK